MWRARIRLNFLGGNLIRPGNLFIDCEDNDEEKPKRIMNQVETPVENLMLAYRQSIYLCNILNFFLTTIGIKERIQRLLPISKSGS